MDNITRTIGAGFNEMSLSEFKLNIDTRTGAVSLQLPKLETLYKYIAGQYGSFSAYSGIRFVDVYSMSGTNNITIIAQDGDKISGSATVVLSSNGIIGTIVPVGDNDWELVTNIAGSGGGGVGVQSGGTALPQQPNLNFIGATVTNDPENKRTNITFGGGSSAIADFFGLTAGTGNGGADDYAATIPVSTGIINQGIPFPRFTINSGGVFTQPTVRKDSVQITTVGTYKIGFNISNIAEAGQLNIETSVDNGITWASFVPTSDSTLFGRAVGASQIIGSAYVTTTIPNQLVRIANAIGNPTALQ